MFSSIKLDDKKTMDISSMLGLHRNVLNLPLIININYFFYECFKQKKKFYSASVTRYQMSNATTL